MSETKGRGRPSKKDTESSEVRDLLVCVCAIETFLIYFGSFVQATKRTASAALPEANGTPAKRGRGRPPKGSKKKGPYVKKNDPLGRGRPPKNAPKKAATKKSGDS